MRVIRSTGSDSSSAIFLFVHLWYYDIMLRAAGKETVSRHDMGKGEAARGEEFGMSSRRLTELHICWVSGFGKVPVEVAEMSCRNYAELRAESRAVVHAETFAEGGSGGQNDS